MPHHQRLLTLITFLVVLWASASIAVQAAPAVSLTALSGPSPYATCTAGGGSISPSGSVNYPNAEVEPYVAVNPKTVGGKHVNLIGVWQQDRWSRGYARGIVAAYSLDGGKSWQTSSLPFDSCAPGGPDLVRASDPWISIGRDGRAYAVALGNGNGKVAVEVSTSIDGGRTWSAPRNAILDDEKKFFDDKESVTADPARPGVAYVVWDRMGSANDAPQPGMFSRTADGGKSWSSPKVIVPAQRPNTGTIGNQVVVDRRTGTLYDIFLNTVEAAKGRTACRQEEEACRTFRARQTKPRYEDYVSFVKSTDGGTTWSKPRNVARDRSAGVPSNLGGPFRTGSGLPSATIDPRSGKIYVVWSDARFDKNRYDEIALSSSSDGGKHWSAPVQVNPPTGHPAFTPAVAVNSRGVVGITYYDLRDGPSGGTTVPTEYWLAVSRDGGQHFGPETHIAGPFDMRSAPFASGYFLGDYQGLGAAGKSFQPFFVTANTGNKDNPTDVFTATIKP